MARREMLFAMTMLLSATAWSCDDDTGGAGPEECHESVVGWPSDWAEFEREVLLLINAERDAGADCGSGGNFPGAPLLAMEPHLRCAARVHSLDMGARGYFSHDSPDGPLGDTWTERIVNAGYQGSPTGENCGAGYPSPAAAVAGWMNSAGHCANIMSANSDEIGVGYAHVPGSGYTHYWTLTFGRE